MAPGRLLLSAMLPLLFDGEDLQAPAFLREPDYYIEKQGGVWIVRKPRVRVLGSAPPAEAWTIHAAANRAAAEEHMNALPRLRLNRPLVRFDPLTRERSPVANWTAEPDAQEAAADVDAIVRRFASPQVHALIASTPLYLARLNGAFAHTAEEPGDPRRYVVYLDPYRATGRLHAAATWVHELGHVARYQARGFHANRAAFVLPRHDFVLLAAADELAAIQAEADLIAAFLDGLPDLSLREAARHAMPSEQLRWPAALRTLLALAGPPDPGARMHAARRQIALDLNRQAARYWAFHHDRVLPRDLSATIRSWYAHSREWSDIARQRLVWTSAGADVREQRGGVDADGPRPAPR